MLAAVDDRAADEHLTDPEDVREVALDYVDQVEVLTELFEAGGEGFERLFWGGGFCYSKGYALLQMGLSVDSVHGGASASRRTVDEGWPNSWTPRARALGLSKFVRLLSAGSG